MSYIRIKNICKSFGNNRVLKDICLDVRKNEFVSLLGSSGCGKTTLLRLIAGLLSADNGSIILDEEDITYKNSRDRKIGMIFQSYALFPTMNVFNNVAYGLRLKKESPAVITREVMSVLEAVDLQHKIASFPSQLSGGEQQRVALARALVTRPKVLLLDEPFNAIDAKLRKALQLKIKEIHNQYEMTSIMVTHDQEEAMRMSDTIFLFREGEVEQSGTPMELYLSPRSKFAASFMGNYNIIAAKDFSKITSGQYLNDQTVAFRPEAIELGEEPFLKSKEAYTFSGEIKSCTPQGSFVRFRLDVLGVLLSVDVSVDRYASFRKSKAVHLSIPVEKMLFYAEDPK